MKISVSPNKNSIKALQSNNLSFGVRIPKVSAEDKFVAKTNQVKDFNFAQPLVEKVIILIEKIIEKTEVSKDPSVFKIEKELEKQGIVARFRNDIEMAKLLKNGLSQIKKTGFNVPKFFLVVKKDVIPGANGATMIFRQSTASKAPILLVKNRIYNVFEDLMESISGTKSFSTTNPARTIFHETGHWLHFHNKPNNEECLKIWSKVDENVIRREVSDEAVRRKDGAEFVAEVFAGIVDGKKYSDYVMDIYKQLNGPLPQK